MTVEPDALTATIRSLLAEVLELAADEVGLDVDLVDELDVDSLQLLALMTMVQDRFAVRLDVEDWRAARTVRELSDRTRDRLAGDPAG